MRRMKTRALSAAAVLLVAAGVRAAPPVNPASVQSVEFIGMDAPSTPAERAQAYTQARVRATYANGRTQEFPLTYNVLHYNTTTIGGVTAGMLYDVSGNSLLDANGNPHISESPDANSLIEVPGTHAATG